MTSAPPLLTRGYVLLLALVVSSIIATVTTGFIGYFTSAVRLQRVAVASAQALALAEAGMDKAVYELNQNGSYSGESDTALGNGVFTVSVSSVDGNTKRISATASVPNATDPIATKTVSATVNINTSVVSFQYAIQLGEGGVVMGNQSRIEGNLFANGDVTGSGTITGDVTVAVGIDPISNQESTAQNTGYNLGDLVTRVNVAQQFTPSVTASLAGLRLNLKKIGNPGDVVIKVVTDNSNKPSTTVLASGVIPASLITSSYGFVEVTLDSTPSLVSGQKYWVIAIEPVNASNYIVWGLDSSGGYSRGIAKYSSNWNLPSPTWSTITGDLGFKLFVSVTSTRISGVTVNGNAWADILSSCTIGGNALYQTSSSCSVGGTSYPGTTPATPTPFPISDAQIAEWETIAAAGGTTAGPYSVSGTKTLGPQKIDGDLTVTNGSALILSGPVWVNGNVTFATNATLTVSPTIGSNGAIIIADATGNTATKGTVSLSTNVNVSGNGSANSFPMIISTNTGSSAMYLGNNADGVILYAPYGTAAIGNGAVVNQITAKQLDLANNSTITYVSGLQSASFSNGPGGSWAVVPGTYVITY